MRRELLWLDLYFIKLTLAAGWSSGGKGKAGYDESGREAAAGGIRAVKGRKEGNGQMEEILMRLSQRDAMTDWREGVSGGGGVHRDVPSF